MVEYCLRCRNKPEENDKFCIKCGSPLINRCTDSKGLIEKGCGKENRTDAAFCSSCGAPTTFYQAGLIYPNL